RHGPRPPPRASCAAGPSLHTPSLRRPEVPVNQTVMVVPLAPITCYYRNQTRSEGQGGTRVSHMDLRAPPGSNIEVVDQPCPVRSLPGSRDCSSLAGMRLIITDGSHAITSMPSLIATSSTARSAADSGRCYIAVA